MSKIPTASEIQWKHDDTKEDWELRAMVEFAKLHVEAALKAAADNAETKEEAFYGVDEVYSIRVVDKDSILNAYPLTNIKKW